MMFSSSRRRSAVRRLGMLTAVATLSFPTLAHADDPEFSAGAYVSFVFGKQLGVGYGLDASLLAYTSGGCSVDSGFGGLVQVGGINGSTLRVVAAAQGGGLLAPPDSPGIVGELGVAAHVLAEEPGVGLHTGVLIDTRRLVNAFFRSEWFLDEHSVGAGARVLGTFGFPCTSMVVDGRPLRTANGVPTEVAELSLATRRDDDHAGLARAWAAHAQAECASVPAFLQLARDLLASGAPDALVERALSAAEDEIRHAHACAAMASRWLEAPVRPALPDQALQDRAAGPDLIARLAVESWLDGALNEGAAAARAGAAAARATDRAARGAQRQIAGDEARHAELGWSVLRWALARGGCDVAERLRALRDVEVPSGGDMEFDHALARSFGRLDAAADEAVTARHAARARRRLEVALAG